jgi:hypothetical protein
MGDESFDGLMLVRTSEPDRVALVLDGTVRRRILDLAFDGYLTVTDKKVFRREGISDPSHSEIVKTVRRVVLVAEALEGARP